MSKHKSKDSSKVGTGSAKNAKMIAPVVTSAVTRKSKCPAVFVEMREEIGDVALVAEFVNTPLLVTPTNQALFPWGNKIARLYTTRKWHRLRLSYVPNTSTTIGGTDMAAMNADPDKPPFDDDDELLNHQGAINSAPYTGWTIDLLQKSNKVPIPEKFNNAQENLLGGDILEDLHTVADGVLNIAVKGLQTFFGASVSVVKTDDKKVQDVKAADPPTEVVTGKFYIDYKVEYNDPVMENVDGGIANWQQNDGDSGRPLVFPEAMFTEETLATPLVNDIAVQVRSKSTPLVGLNQLIGLKFASRGLYAVMLTTNADSGVGAADVINIANTSLFLSDFTEDTQHWYGGPDTGSGASTAYSGGSSFFILLNVNGLATEDSGSAVLVDDLWCDAVISLYNQGANFDGYVQNQARLYVMKLGSIQVDVPTRLARRKGGLKNSRVAAQLAFFEKRALVKMAQVKATQRSVVDMLRSKGERKVANARTVVSANAPTAANVKAVVGGPASGPASAGAAAGPPARSGGEAKALGPARAVSSPPGLVPSLDGQATKAASAKSVGATGAPWPEGPVDIKVCAKHPVSVDSSCPECVQQLMKIWVARTSGMAVRIDDDYVQVQTADKGASSAKAGPEAQKR